MATIKPISYSRRGLPALQESDRQYLTEELRKIEQSIRTLVAAVDDIIARLAAASIP